MFDGAASLASARSKVSAALNNSDSFWSFSTLETPTPSGISNTKRTKVGCTEARTRIGDRFWACAAARCWRKARSAARARSDSSRTTSAGRPAAGRSSVGQQVDEHPLARRHGVDGHLARQRQPDRRAVGIAPRRPDIIGHRVGQFFDRNVHRALEPDHEDGAGGRHLGLDVLGELEHQPGVAAGSRKRRLAPHRLGLADRRRGQAEQDQPGREPRSPAASRDVQPGQRRAVRAQARPRDQNPAAAVRAIPTGSFSFDRSVRVGGTPSPRAFES